MKNNLPPLRFRLDEERKRTNIQLNILEQDYLLSWVLYGISMVPELRNSLAFKGGTALKKCYFGKYRFSEDLDFSLVGRTKDVDAITRNLRNACDVALKEMGRYIPNPRLVIDKYTEKRPHPEGQLAYVIKAQLPWHREPTVKVMTEISINEVVVRPLVEKRLIHGYGENLDCSLLVYSLEEIIAEKLRAILQYTKKLHEHSWARSRVRDYYDLWNIFRTFDSMIDYGAIKDILRQKCIAKNVTFTGLEDFFQPIAINEVNKTWELWLKPLVIKLSQPEDVINEIKQKLKETI
jgi:predicted nucleotidyltransferase component of viral defense system